MPVCRSCGEETGLPSFHEHTGPCWHCWGNGTWEHGMPKVTTGTKDRVQKLKALGNGLMWQIPYAITRAIQDLEFEEELPW